MSAMAYEVEASALGGGWTVCWWLHKNSVHMYSHSVPSLPLACFCEMGGRTVGLQRSPSLFEAAGPTGPVYSLTLV